MIYFPEAVFHILKECGILFLRLVGKQGNDDHRHRREVHADGEDDHYGDKFGRLDVHNNI